jgi:hypothetical protein
MQQQESAGIAKLLCLYQQQNFGQPVKAAPAKE